MIKNKMKITVLFYTHEKLIKQGFLHYIHFTLTQIIDFVTFNRDQCVVYCLEMFIGSNKFWFFIY